MKWLLIGFVKAWRAVVSPLYGPVCKYYPSCSAYGLEALRLHGAVKGSALAVWRILRCNPWSRGGVDPVPGSELAAQVAQWWPADGVEIKPESIEVRRDERPQMGDMASRSARGQAGGLLSVVGVARAPRWGRAVGANRRIWARTSRAEAPGLSAAVAVMG